LTSDHTEAWLFVDNYVSWAPNQKLRTNLADTQYTDEDLIQLLQNNSDKAIEIIFKRYFPEMVRSANRLLQDENTAKDVIQEVFYKFWNNRERLNIQSTIRGYLRRSSVNAALDHLRKKT